MATKTLEKTATEQLAREHFEYFNKRKLAEGAKHITSGYQNSVVPFGEVQRGKQGYLDGNQRWIDALPDVKCEITKIVASGNTAVIEFRGKGTHKGPLVGPKGTIAPTGKKVDMPVVEICEFEDQKLHRVRTYFDSATLMQQIGVKA